MHFDESNIPNCDRFADISEYLDGELSAAAEMSLEEHFVKCSECRAEFNLQKQFHNILNSTLETEPEFKLPDNFAKAVATAAESDVRSLRRSHEIRNAGAIILIALAFAGVIAALSGGAVSGGAAIVVDKVTAVITAGWHLVYSLALGVSVMVRSLTSGIKEHASIWLAIAGVAGLVLMIPILFFRPRRSRNA